MSVKTVFLFTLIFMAAIPSCKGQHSENTQDLLLSIDFNDSSESVFSDLNARQLAYSAGVEGKGLDLESCFSIPSLRNTDSTWFSNRKNFTVAVWVKSKKATPETTIILSNSDFREKDAGI